MVDDRRASENPLVHLKAINAKADRRRIRRALTVDEIRNLIETTKNRPERYGMTGPERAMLYRVAVETGLRAGELRSLKVSSFDLKNCTVTVEAAYSKHRDQDTIPIKPETANTLRDFFRGKLPLTAAFNVPERTADMFQDDLADAGILYIDESGHYADFHSLRHTTGSLLAASGVHPKVAQKIMRHSTVELTLNRYSHVYRGQETEAVGNLPDLSLPSSKQKAAAAGTDGAGKNLASCLALSCGKQRISADDNGQNRVKNQDNSNLSKSTKKGPRGPVTQKNESKTKLPEEGLEPSRPCGQGILSPQRLPIPPLGRFVNKGLTAIISKNPFWGCPNCVHFYSLFSIFAAYLSPSCR